MIFSLNIGVFKKCCYFARYKFENNMCINIMITNVLKQDVTAKGSGCGLSVTMFGANLPMDYSLMSNLMSVEI